MIVKEKIDTTEVESFADRSAKKKES